MKAKLTSLLTAALAPFVASAALADPKPQTMTFAAGPSVSAVYAIGAGFGQMIEKTVPGSRVTVVEGGTVSNAARIIRGQVQMGYSKPATILAAQTGAGKPFDKPSEDVLSVAGIVPGPLHLAVDSSLGVRTFDEIVQKKAPIKIAIGQAGYSSEVFFRQIIQEYGITFEDIKGWGGDVRLLSMSEGATAMRDGQVNAVITPDVIPHSGVTQIAQARNMTLISFSEDLIKKLSDKYGYTRAVIPAGSYRGVDYAVTTLDDPYIIVAHREMSEDFIYALTKEFLSDNGRKFFSAISAPIGTVDAKSAYAMIAKNKLHPGAVKYFKEIGAIK